MQSRTPSVSFSHARLGAGRANLYLIRPGRCNSSFGQSNGCHTDQDVLEGANGLVLNLVYLVLYYVPLEVRPVQSLLPTLLAVLFYLGSLLGVTPGGGTDRSAEGNYPPPSAVQPVAPIPPVSYPGATEVMAYYAELRAGDPAPLRSLSQAARALTTVIPFAYRIDAAGNISGRIDRRLLTLARANGLKVLALVHNAGTGRFDAGTAHALLTNPLARQRAIDQLYTLLIQSGLDGVNLDLENVPARDRWFLTSFVRDLAAKLRPRHFLLTASLPAKLKDDRKSSWSGAYDYQALNPYLDQVVLMTYDEHVPGGQPGPVASYGWVDRVVRYAVTAFPRQKIVLGIPAYGYVWSSRGDRAVNYGQVASLIKRNGVSPVWDHRAQVPYFQYSQAGYTHRVWYENNRSAALKASLVKTHGLRGVAVWRLGNEDPALWAALAQKLA